MKVLLMMLALLPLSCALHPSTSLPTMPFDKEGHRGCRGLMPENTIPAMLKALDLGVTTLEMDAVITADSQVILSHEPFFNHAITTKQDGTFIPESEERTYNIYKMTYAETQKFDVGLKPNPRFPQQQKLAATKPLLRDVIDSAERYVKEHNRSPVYYNIETKTTPLTDGIYHTKPDVFVRLLMQVITEKGITERVFIQSFDVRTLQILHQQFPQVKTSLLVEDDDTRPFKEQLKRLGFTPTIYSPAYNLVDAALVQQCKAAGVQLIPWTVNDKETIVRLKQLGVDGLISDYPNLFAGL